MATQDPTLRLLQQMAQAQTIQQMGGVNLPIDINNPSISTDGQAFYNQYNKRNRGLSTLTDILRGTASGLASGQGGALWQGISNAVDARRKGDWVANNLMQQEQARRQEMLARQFQQNSNRDFLENNLGVQSTGGEDMSLVNQSMPFVMGKQTGGAFKDLASGKDYSQVDFGSMPAEQQRQLFEYLSKRLGDITDSQAHQRNLQQGGYTNMAQQPQAGQPVQQPQAANPYAYNEPDTIQAGVRYTAPPDMSMGGLFTTPAIAPQDINTAQNNNFDYKVDNRRADTAQYEAETGRQIYQATKNNQGGYARYAPAGPMPNEAYYKDKYIQANQLTPQQAFGSSSGVGDPLFGLKQAQAITQNLQNMGLENKNGKPIGAARDPRTPQGQAYAALNSRRTSSLGIPLSQQTPVSVDPSRSTRLGDRMSQQGAIGKDELQQRINKYVPR